MTKKLPPDPEDMNARRAHWAASALADFQHSTGTDNEDALCDLLGDLMHWSDRNNFDFDSELSRARTHYEAETMAPPENDCDEPALLAAARLVIDRWTSGDLADAVRQLDAAVAEATGGSL